MSHLIRMLYSIIKQNGLVISEQLVEILTTKEKVDEIYDDMINKSE